MPIYHRNIINEKILSLFVCICTITPFLCAAEGENPAKKSAIAEKTIAKKQLTQKKIAVSPQYVREIASLVGKYVEAKFSADGIKQAEAAQALFQASKGKPEGEFFLFLIDNDYLPNPVYQNILKKLSFDGCAPNVASALARLKLDRLNTDELEPQEHETILRMSGRLGGLARLSGPFNYLQYPQRSRPTATERNPAATEYPKSMGCDVAVRTIVSDKDNNFKTGNSLPENAMDSTCVLQLTLKSDNAQQALLHFGYNSIISATLNGLPVYATDMHDENFPESAHFMLRVNLNKGTNCLLVKLSEGSSMDVALLDDKGAALSGISITGFDANAWKNITPSKTAGYYYSAPLTSLYIDSLKDLCKAMPEFPGQSLLAMGYTQQKQTVRADEIFSKLYKASTDNPDLYVARAQYADFLLENRYNGFDSGERYTESAARLLHELRKSKYCPLLSQLQLANYYKDLKQFKQQQALLLKLQKKYPNAMALNYDLSQYYQKNKWPTLALEAVDKVVKEYPQTVSWKINLLRKQKNFTAALELAEKAYKDHEWCSFDSLKSLRKRCGDKDSIKDTKKSAAKDGQTEEEKKNATLAEEYESALESADIAKALNTLEVILKKMSQDAALNLLPDGGNEISELEKLSAKALEKGNLDKAAEILLKLAKLNPQNPNRWADLGKIQVRMGKDKKAAANLTKAFILGCQQYAPKPGLLRQARQLKGETPQDEKYFKKLDPQTIKSVTKPANARASHATIARTRIVEIFPGICGSITVRNAVKVFDRNGINRLAEQNTKGDIIFCRTIDENGKVFIPDSAENLNLKNAMSMYNVRPGSVIDYASRGYISGSHRERSFKDLFYFQDANAQVKSARYVLIIPKQMLQYADIRTVPEDLKPTVTEISKKRIAIVWEQHDLPVIEYEKGMPKAKMMLSNISINIYPREKVYDEPPFGFDANTIHTSSDIIAKTAEICKDIKEDRQKVLAIYNWISKNIREEGYNESPRDTFIRRSGNTEDMLSLCQAMLQSQGIKSWKSATNTSLNTPNFLDNKERVKHAADFNWEPVLHVKMNDLRPDLWLTFHYNQRFFRMDDVEQNQAGALTLEQSPRGLITGNFKAAEMGIPPRFSAESVALNADGSAEVQVQIKLEGSNAANMRQNIQNPRERQMGLQQFAAAAFPAITGIQSDLKGADNPPSPPATEGLQVTIKGNVLQFSQKADNKLFFKRDLDFYSPNMASTLPRTYPFMLNNDVLEADQQHFKAPKGWAFQLPPQDCWLVTRFGLLSVDYTVNGPELSRSVFTIIPAQKIAPEDCAEFNHFLSEIKKRLQVSFTLEKIPSGTITTPFKEPILQQGFPGSYLKEKHLCPTLRKYLQD